MRDVLHLCLLRAPTLAFAAAAAPVPRLIDASCGIKLMPCLRRPAASGCGAFDKRARRISAAHAQTVIGGSVALSGPFEAKRRLRKFEVRTLDECSKGCKFSQSELTIDLD